MTDVEAVTRAEYLAGVVAHASERAQTAIQEAINGSINGFPYHKKAIEPRGDVMKWVSFSESKSAEICKDGAILFLATARLRLARKIESMEGEIARVREITVG